MCGRYVSPNEAALERFYTKDRRSPGPFKQSFNVAPTASVPIITQAADGSRAVEIARWSLIPAWWKQDKPPNLTFNARSEEAAGKPMWRDAYRYSRCLMPAQGWYEWQEPGSVDPETGEVRMKKQPFYLHAANDECVAFAGLLSRVPQPDGTVKLSCALLSKAAAPSVAFVHDRMPVVLTPAAFARWLDPDLKEPALVAELVNGSRTDFAAYAVSTLVNSAKNDDPRLLDRLAP